MVQGRFHVEMDNGESAEFGPGDVMNVPPGHDVWVVGDEPVVVVDVLGNIAALGVPGEHERLVTTLLMTDIVDSTLTATRLGDAAWKQVLAEHNRLVRAQLDRFRGREVNTTGDGFLATFGSAVGAIRSAVAMRDAVRGLGIELRIGVHTGEVEVLPNDIGGVAVHAASRIMALGRASEIIVSSVTRGLVEGSDLRFEERGRQTSRAWSGPSRCSCSRPDRSSGPMSTLERPMGADTLVEGRSGGQPMTVSGPGPTVSARRPAGHHEGTVQQCAPHTPLALPATTDGSASRPTTTRRSCPRCAGSRRGTRPPTTSSTPRATAWATNDNETVVDGAKLAGRGDSGEENPYPSARRR